MVWGLQLELASLLLYDPRRPDCICLVLQPVLRAPSHLLLQVMSLQELCSFLIKASVEVQRILLNLVHVIKEVDWFYFRI